MDEDRLTRARSRLLRIEAPTPDVHRVRRLARSRRLRASIGSGIAAAALVVGIVVPVLGLRSLGGGGGRAAGPDDGIRFLPAQGWFTESTGASSWASNEPLSGDPPLSDLAGLDLDGILIVVWEELPLEGESVSPNANFPEHVLPLRLSDAEVRLEWEGQPDRRIPEYLLLSTIEGRWIDARIYFGRPDPTPEQLASAQEELARLVVPPAPAAVEPSPSPDADARYLPPYLAGGPEWNTWSSDPAPRDSATVAWASSIPIGRADVEHRAAIPPSTIEALPPDGVVITALATPWSYDPALGPFPYDLSGLELGSGVLRGPDAEEPPGDYAVIKLDLEAVLIRVYFGSAHPSRDVIDTAQRELDTLQLPPTCPFYGVGTYAVRASVSEGVPGDAVTISGAMPFQHEDGSYDTRGQTMMVAWWNARPRDWPDLASSSTPSTSPAVEAAPLLRLGEDGGNVCEFAISFVVPDVPRGTYPIVVIQEGGGGASATMEGALELQVEGPG